MPHSGGKICAPYSVATNRSTASTEVIVVTAMAAAEVSPSSVYRYFGTKEGLIVADEFDSWS